MKKFIIIIVCIALIIFVCYRDKDYKPYSGSYELTSNLNCVLRLNKDNSFILSVTVGKTSEFVKGKYQIEDNNITLTPSKNNVDKYITNTLHGKVEGSSIKIVELRDDFVKY